MKLLLDEGLPRSVASLLNTAGIDTVHVGEIGYASAEDAAILQKARETERILITLDADFHALIALSGASTTEGVRIRIKGLRGEALAELVQQVLEQSGDELEQGALVTVQAGQLRIRRLPLMHHTGDEP